MYHHEELMGYVVLEVEMEVEIVGVGGDSKVGFTALM
jgi:hypothetical protein